MASVTARPNGDKWVQFKGLDGKRKTLRLGGISETQAREYCRRVDDLISAGILGQSFSYELTEWLAKLPVSTYDRLVQVGLTKSRDSTRTLGDLLLAFQTSRKVTAGTNKNLARVYEHLREFFTESRELWTILPADADDFRNWLPDAVAANRSMEALAPATVSKRCRIARDIFTYGVRKLKWLPENPFGLLKGWVDTNRDRDFYVDEELTLKLIESATSAEFRALLACVRGAAFRCPSEIAPFRWEWIDWEDGKLHVRSPKTNRYDDKSQRTIPLFPIARHYLLELQEVAEIGEPLVFPNYQKSDIAIRNQLERLCRSIGIVMWPKPFINMRGSCETDLVESFPIHVVAAWVGHSPRIMQKHYVKVTKEHFARAVAGNYASSFTSLTQPSPLAKQKAKQRMATSGNGIVGSEHQKP